MHPTGASEVTHGAAEERVMPGEGEAGGGAHHFIRLMGREASHLTLEVALNTRPTLAFIGEEVKRRSLTLSQIANEIVEVVLARAEAGVGFGVVLIPEGLIDFIPEALPPPLPLLTPPAASTRAHALQQPAQPMPPPHAGRRADRRDQ